MAVSLRTFSKKGCLIDVFNFDGEFIDSFYVNFKGSLMNAHKDSIFVMEKDEEENLQIVKYRITEQEITR